MFNVILDGESKPATMDEIENNWIIEHARQVDILKLWMFMSSYNFKTPYYMASSTSGQDETNPAL